MRVIKRIGICLLGILFLLMGAACSKEEVRYEIVMKTNVNGELLYANQVDPVVEADIGTAPFEYGFFSINIWFNVTKIEDDSRIEVTHWGALEPGAGFMPSDFYGSRVDLQSYIIYDENGEHKNQQVEDWDSCEFFNMRFNDIEYLNEFYLANIAGLHEITYKVCELPEYGIPETIFTIKLNAEEDERLAGAEIVAEEDPNITKIEGGEKSYDIYLVSEGAYFPKFKICEKETGEKLNEEYDCNLRKFGPNYEENVIQFDGPNDYGRMYWAYVQFDGNEIYQPTSYYFYVIYLY